MSHVLAAAERRSNAPSPTRTPHRGLSHGGPISRGFRSPNPPDLLIYTPFAFLRLVIPTRILRSIRTKEKLIATARLASVVPFLHASNWLFNCRNMPRNKLVQRCGKAAIRRFVQIQRRNNLIPCGDRLLYPIIGPINVDQSIVDQPPANTNAYRQNKRDRKQDDPDDESRLATRHVRTTPPGTSLFVLECTANRGSRGGSESDQAALTPPPPAKSPQHSARSRRS